MSASVLVVGQGYVGLPLAIESARVGHRVTGLDTSQRRVDLLSAGESFTSDVDEATLRQLQKERRYTICSRLDDSARFDVIIITVPTPLHEGLPDLAFVEEAAAIAGRHIELGGLIVLESTTYPGTTTELLQPIVEEESGLKAGVDFSLGYSPERIDPGNKQWMLTNTPKLYSGIDSRSSSAISAFYGEFVPELVEVSTPASAELAKLLENTFRHVNIALVNELSVFADSLDVDIWEAIDAAATKPFGFMPFYPGPGVGGHCLPIDPSYLSWRVTRLTGERFRFVELANDVNSSMPHFVIRRVIRLLNDAHKSVNGSSVVVIGAAYKRDTTDTREAPTAPIVDMLQEMGAIVTVMDPLVSGAGGAAEDLNLTKLQAADLCVLLVDHSDLPWDRIATSAQCILDCRRRLSGSNVFYL